MKSLKIKSGFGLIEVVLGIVIIVFIFLGILTAYNKFVSIVNENTKSIKATFLLEEGLEALRILRNSGWGNIRDLSVGTDYGLVFSGNSWATSTSPQYLDGIERTFSLGAVLRDGNDDISTSGTVDDGSRSVMVSVSWFGNGATTTRQTNGFITKLNL